MTNVEALALAFIPGHAESLEREASTEVTLSMYTYRLAGRVKYIRDILYVSVVSTVTAATLEVVFKNNTSLQYTCAAVTILGTGITLISGKILYDTTSEIQSQFNHARDRAAPLV